MPLTLMDQEQRERFEDHPFADSLSVFPEVGSRAMQRILIAEEDYNEGWLEVQEGRYRYLAAGEGEIVIKGVLSEYLAYEVIWS